MNLIFGAVITLFSIIAWVGQVISAVSPTLGAKLGLIEDEGEVDKVFFTDQRGEAVWDSLVLWPMVLAGILLMLGVPSWVYFGITGGAVFTYFCGRGIVTRLLLKKKGFRIGNPANLKTNLIFLFIWMAMGIGTMVYALGGLSGVQ